MTSFPHLRPAEMCHVPGPQCCHGAGALPRSADFSGYQCETSKYNHPPAHSARAVGQLFLCGLGITAGILCTALLWLP